jgi:deazaflavin-dependent oxidoreductase (nitroreductase family)
MNAPRFVFRLMKIGPQVAYAIGLGPLIGRVILLLTTTGRISGKKRVTPLQYEEVAGNIVIASARGASADWYRNLEADPHVEVQVKGRHFYGLAEPCADPETIADFLALRLERHPRTVGRIMKSQGASAQPTRDELLEYARNRTMVTIRETFDTRAI